MCCHNRKNKTLKSLEGIFSQKGLDELELKVVLVDDGSTDGTSGAVNQNFPSVKVVQGTGKLFWAGGMRLAYQEAEPSDFYLWLNDDTELYTNALSNLIKTNELIKGDKILTGAVKDVHSQKVSYGGLRRISNTRLRFAVLEPAHINVECDATNGNCVLIPEIIYKKIGNIDENFVHAHGDIDFGLRARQAGFKIYLCKHYIGQSETKFLEDRVYNGTNSFSQRIRAILSLKALKPKEWILMCMRHSHHQVLLSFISPYLRALNSRPIGFVQRPKG